MASACARHNTRGSESANPHVQTAHSLDGLTGDSGMKGRHNSAGSGPVNPHAQTSHAFEAFEEDPGMKTVVRLYYEPAPFGPKPANPKLVDEIAKVHFVHCTSI